MPINQYKRYVDNYSSPKGGIPWKRETFAMFRHDQKVVQTGGLSGGTIGGTGGWIVSIR